MSDVESWLDDFLEVQSKIMNVTDDVLVVTAAEIVDSAYLSERERVSSLAEMVGNAARCRANGIARLAHLCELILIVLGQQGRTEADSMFRSSLHAFLFPTHRIVKFDESQIPLVYFLFKHGVFTLAHLEAGFDQLIWGIRLAMKNPKVLFSANEVHFYLCGLAIYFGPGLHEHSPRLAEDVAEALSWVDQHENSIDFKTRSRELKRIAANEWELWHCRFDDRPTNVSVTDALRTDDIELLMTFMQEPRADINATLPSELLSSSEILENHPSLIQAAAFYGSVKCFKYLWLNKANLEYQDHVGRRISVYAVIGGSIEIIRLLQNEIQYEQALASSIVYHQYAVFEWIDQTLPYPLSEISLEAALGDATVHNNVHTFEYYKDRIDRTAEFLQNLLEQALSNGHAEVIFYLLDLIAVRLEQQVIDRYVCIAADGCPVSVVELLVSGYHGDPGAMKEGWRPLQIAAKGGFQELVQYFAGFPNVDLNAGTEVAAPALHQAANEGLSEIVKFLLTVEGVDVNARDAKGFTALHCAARWNQMEVLRLLLEVPGIDLSAVDDRNVCLLFPCKHLSTLQ
jgi:ankyrin repeat protein